MHRHATKRWRRSAAPALTVLGLTLAACGSGDDPVTAPLPGGTASSETTASPDGRQELEVNAEDIAFDVERIEVAAGQAATVTFHNNDTDVPHNFHVEAGDLDATTDITPGPDTQTLEFTIDEAGSFTFVCDVHPEMTGELVVS